MNIPIFVINLDRRPDRLEFMARQLDGFGLSWERVAAHDMETVDQSLLSKRISTSKPRIGMGPGSQCCALTSLDIYRRILDESLPAALILQDDVVLSQEIVPFLSGLDWLPDQVNLVQFEKYGRKSSYRLMGPAMGTMPSSGSLHKLYSRTAGAACYLVTRSGAAIIEQYQSKLDIPIDHFLFSPNVSPVFDALNVTIVRPALARQRDDLRSDILAERSARRKPTRERLLRLWYDVNRLPSQMVAMTQGARWERFSIEDQELLRALSENS